MPGILPMKVIGVGNNAQSRTAPACNRCRSKKIRCDSIRPQCTQCSNVGFECKTSDKLSRRAFPRGYTESLEDHPGALDAEVREVKVLLDEKTKDRRSPTHSFFLLPPRKGSASLPFVACQEVKAEFKASNEESIQIEAQSPSCPPNLPGSQSCTITLIAE
ncbi:hypothetical protein GJ744_003541 [Endocarpon pusillum]|uniref:Zn(2)-C6 fungal-type domain-containing protein n=1 Tax=Endocarpon pusillum TaxID=364733 RepID=A0A8H7E7Z8_9EURO|nr:hypothetical protein GJ744_003541 [Endocarpon pusillum]